VQTRLERAGADAVRFADHIRDAPEYLQGFAAGVRRARDAYLGDDCGSLLASTLAGFTASPPGGHERDWQQGYADGQGLVYSLELLQRLPRCFVPVPPLPPPAS
jgi:hypothetical protein